VSERKKSTKSSGYKKEKKYRGCEREILGFDLRERLGYEKEKSLGSKIERTANGGRKGEKLRV
jgi:hypothetical protein